MSDMLPARFPGVRRLMVVADTTPTAQSNMERACELLKKSGSRVCAIVSEWFHAHILFPAYLWSWITQRLTVDDIRKRASKE